MAEAKKRAVKAKKETEVKEEPQAAVEATKEPTATTEETKAEPKTATAKAGKRSTKAVREVEEKVEKQERKAEASTSDKPKPTTKNPTRPKAERAGKKYREAAKLVEADKLYSLAEALDLATKTSTTKFDSTVELHINLGVDPRQADQNVRDIVVLPAGTGKTVRIAVFAEGDDIKKAKDAGADFAGNEELLAQLDKEDINFEVLISTPMLMAKLGKYARMLGPRGLMPNPKSGTVTTDVAKAVTEAKAGRVEFRVDQAGIVHLGVGKVSFGADKLSQNATAVIASIRAAKPASLKGSYIKTAHITTSMGPSIKVEL
ncbi:MAG: ribosomal protein [Candidatus Saccharibacteria bacterium]|nr:ribosomal protein [Candidatus Saccharibacteria bacterium]